MIAVIGTALAFIVGFKNNASYDRIWEARKIWGGIIRVSRSLALMSNDFITNQHAKNVKTEEELFAEKKQIIMRHIAWMTVLRHTLRIKKPWETFAYNKSDIAYIANFKIQEYTFTLEEELNGYLSQKEFDEVLSKKNKASYLLTMQSNHFKKLLFDGLIEDFRHIEMEKQLIELIDLQGGCERIKNFPYPRQFATLNIYFVWLFIFLLPLGTIPEFDQIAKSLADNSSTPFLQFVSQYFVWVAVPGTSLISWIFLLMERIGDVSENPFEGGGNDIPITTISRDIEIDIREMIGDNPNEIPKPHPAMYNTQM